MMVFRTHACKMATYGLSQDNRRNILSQDVVAGTAKAEASDARAFLFRSSERCSNNGPLVQLGAAAFVECLLHERIRSRGVTCLTTSKFDSTPFSPKHGSAV